MSQPDSSYTGCMCRGIGHDIGLHKIGSKGCVHEPERRDLVEETHKKDDILTVMRFYEYEADHTGPFDHELYPGGYVQLGVIDVRRASDELAALRDTVETNRTSIMNFHQENAQLRAENERLKDEVEKLYEREKRFDSRMVEVCKELRAENERLRVEAGEIKLVLESQDLHLHKLVAQLSEARKALEELANEASGFVYAHDNSCTITGSMWLQLADLVNTADSLLKERNDG